MNKELEQWIEENMPDYGECYEDEQVEYCEEGFKDGAELMADHLHSQPPTKEQIIGVLQYVYNELLPDEDITQKGFGILVEDILNKWNK